MSAAKLFPPFQPVAPKTLSRALQDLAKLHTGSGTFNSNRWELLLEKVRSGSRLSNLDKIHMTCNCGAIPAELMAQFARLFIADLNEEVLIASTQSILVSLAPSRAIELLTAPEIQTKYGDKHLPAGVFANAKFLGREAEEQDWIDSEIQRGSNVLRIVRNLAWPEFGPAFTSGQLRICRRMLASKALPKVIDSQFSEVFELLSSLNGESTDRIQIVDDILGRYFSFDSSWSTKVLDESFFFAKLLKRLPDLTGERIRLDRYKNIQLLRQKIDEISNVLRELNEVEPDRGNFWKKYLSMCQYVEPKRIDKKSVAVAFAFPNFVIVEFAPVGTSALLYNRQSFDSKVRQTKSWRDLETVMPFAPYSSDGRLLHVTGWQGKFNQLIVLLLRRGGSIR